MSKPKPRLSRKLLLSKLRVWKAYETKTLRNGEYYWASPDGRLFHVCFGDHSNLAWVLTEAAGHHVDDPTYTLYRYGFCRIGIDDWVLEATKWSATKRGYSRAIRRVLAAWKKEAPTLREVNYV